MVRYYLLTLHLFQVQTLLLFNKSTYFLYLCAQRISYGTLIHVRHRVISIPKQPSCRLVRRHNDSNHPDVGLVSIIHSARFLGCKAIWQALLDCISNFRICSFMFRPIVCTCLQTIFCSTQAMLQHRFARFSLFAQRSGWGALWFRLVTCRQHLCRCSISYSHSATLVRSCRWHDYVSLGFHFKLQPHLHGFSLSWRHHLRCTFRFVHWLAHVGRFQKVREQTYCQ